MTHQHNMSQRLVKRGGELAEAVDALPVTQGLSESGTERQAEVLVRVVVVYVRVARGVRHDIKQPVARNLLGGRERSRRSRQKGGDVWS
jgi:hypothetical protein